MTRIFVARHGQTEGNESRIYRGRWDLPLNENGLEQAKRAAGALQGVTLSAIYTSPLRRAMQTADAVAVKQKVQPVEEEGLIDIDYGDWTRMPDARVAEEFPDLYRRWKQSPETMVFPGGEGLSSVRARVEPALTRLAERHPDENIALVSHRVPIKILLCAALGLDESAFWKVQIDTASITALDFHQGAFSLLFSNETCHLKPLGEKLGVADF